jgi:gliding motility-associated-like protein
MAHFLLKQFLLSTVLVLTLLSAQGAHLVGGEIFYKCLGNGQYVVTLKMYRDCNGTGAPFDQNASIGIYRGTNNSLFTAFTIPFSGVIDTLAFNQNIPCLVDTPDVCISTTSYIDTITLEVPLGGLYVVHQRCCRPPNVVNINNVQNVGSSYLAFIPDSTVAPCNSSPYYNDVPPIALCSELYLDIDHSATDDDGDSLIYTICRPNAGGTPNNPAPNPPSPPPYQGVPWAGGFNDQNQITALPVIKIDSASGQITGRPTQIGTFAFGVCVQEWRNGVFLSENKRDFQLTTTYCEVDAAAAIDSALEECIGFDIQFFNLSTLGDSFTWDFGDTNTLDDTSTYENPIYTFPDTGTYWVTLIAYGDVCTDTARFPYRVQHKIEPFFEVPDPGCLDGHKFRFTPSGFYRGSTQMRWEFLGDTAEITDDDLPLATKIYDSVGIHYITLHYTDPKLGCYKFYTDSVEIWPNPTIDIVEGPDEMCAPYFGAFSSSISEAYLPRYQWYLDSTLISERSYTQVESDDIGLHDLRIVLTTDSMCIDTIDRVYTAHVNVLDTPSAGIEVTPLVADMFHPQFTITDQSVNRVSWKYFVDDRYLSRNNRYELVLPDTGNYVVSQVAYHLNGCTDTTSMRIRVKPEYLTFVPNAFTPNGDLKNDEWKPSVFVHKTYALRIYDRWGHVLFRSEDPQVGWNGREENIGRPCPSGVYTYDLFITDEDDRQYNYNGSLILIR